MRNVNEIVNEVIDDINAEAVEKTEKQVRKLVSEILELESNIAEKQRRVAEAKEELRALQMPKPVKVEL